MYTSSLDFTTQVMELFFCWCLTLLCVFLFQVLRHTEERWHLRYGEEFEKKLRGMDFDINYTANSALHFGSCCKSLDSGGLRLVR